MEREEFLRLYLDKNPNYFSADQARHLLPGYYGLNSSKYQKASGALAESALFHFIEKYRDSRGIIYWTAGGTGAGKTETVKKIIKFCPTNHCVFDSTLANKERSLNRIHKGIENGFRQLIIYSHRPVEQSFTHGVIKRIRDGKKRIVPIRDHIQTHINARRNIHELSKELEYSDSVQILIYDNSRPGEKPKKQSLSNLEEYDFNPEEQKDILLNAAINLCKEGAISKKQLRSLSQGL